MSKRALRLHEKHSKDELVQMQRDVLADPQNRNPSGGVYVLTPKAAKLHEDLGWAIYWHGAPKGNTRMHSPLPQMKFW